MEFLSCYWIDCFLECDGIMVNVGIVGGSYAGLSAAISASKEGAEVTVYEKKTDITKFACGEIYTSGLYGVGPPSKDCRYYAANNFVFHFDEGDVKLPLPSDSLWLTNRAKIQQEMYDTAKGIGVKFHIGESTLLSMHVKDYDYVIDASGFPSQSGYEGYSERIKPQAVPLYYNVFGDFSDYFDKDLHFWWLSGSNRGYAWLFPKTKNEANLGIGWETSVHQSPRFEDVRAFFQKLLKHSIDFDAPNVTRGAGVLPLDRIKRFTKGNVAIVGEAAGLMNYVFGAGAHFAIASGREAGSSIAKGSFHSYDKYVETELLKEVVISKTMLKTIGKLSPHLFRKVCIGIAKGPGMNVFHGKFNLLGALKYLR